MKAAAILASALALLAAPAAAAGPPARGALVPGRSLGGVRLGAPITAVLRAWGRSFGVCRNCRDPTWYFTFGSFEPEGVAASFRGGRVRALFTLWAPARWRSSGGVAIGDPASRVVRAYGKLARTDCDGYYALTSRRRGAVTAFYVRDGKVWGFGLSRPGVPPCR